MPQISESTPRADITIQGLTFAVPQPYTEGHVLSANEASALNQVFAENIRNNCAGKVKANEKARETEGGEVLSDEQLLAQFEEYATSYEFGQRRVGSGVSEARLSPEEREARRIAGEQIKAALKAKGIKVKDVDEDRFETMVATLAAREDVIKEAKRRVSNLSKISIEELDLDGSVEEGAEPAEVAA